MEQNQKGDLLISHRGCCFNRNQPAQKSLYNEMFHAQQTSLVGPKIHCFTCLDNKLQAESARNKFFISPL